MQPSGVIQKKRVLHVDDNEALLYPLKQILEMINSSFEVTPCNDPVIALERLKTEHYDCIILDYKMPGMNGIELAAKIRETLDTPLILYTGEGSEEVAEAAFKVGVDDYMRKEFDPGHYKVLENRVNAAVDRTYTGKLYHTVVEASRDDLVFLLESKI